MVRRLGLALALSGLAAVGFGQTFFPNDATISYPISNGAVVGYGDYWSWQTETNKSSPIVSVVAGASINALGAYNGSKVTIQDAAIGNLNSTDSATIDFRSGSISGTVEAWNQSILSLYSGTTSGLVKSDYGGRLNLYGTRQTNGGFYFAGRYSHFAFYGTGLTSTYNGRSLGTDYYGISGTLTDGTVLNGTELLVYNPDLNTTVGDGTFSLNAVPEPATVVFLTAGFVAVVGRRRRR